MRAILIRTVVYGVLPLLLLWLMYPLANTVVRSMEWHLPDGMNHHSFSKFLEDGATNTFSYGFAYIAFFFFGQILTISLRWIFVFISGASTLLCAWTLLMCLIDLFSAPKEFKALSAIETVVSAIDCAVWVWLTINMIRVFDL